MINTKLQTKIISLDKEIVLENNNIESVVKKIKQISETHKRKFDESVDLAIGLQLNKKDNTSVRGSFDLTHGHGKYVKLLVFAEDKMGDFAKSCGADMVGGTELINKIKNNEIKLEADYCIALESMMKELPKIAAILSGKKIMPNKKEGTIILDNEDVLKATINNIKEKTVFFKNDKQGYLRFSVGKVSFSEQQLIDNISMALGIVRSFNKTPKVSLIKNILVSTTMGIGVPITVA